MLVYTRKYLSSAVSHQDHEATERQSLSLWVFRQAHGKQSSEHAAIVADKVALTNTASH